MATTKRWVNALDVRNGAAEAVWSFVIGPSEVIPSTNISKALVEEGGYYSRLNLCLRSGDRCPRVPEPDRVALSRILAFAVAR